MLKRKLPGKISCGTPLASRPSFDVVFKEFYPPLVFFANRLVKEQTVAEDIVTDIFQKLWLKLDGFSSVSSIRAFMYISTRNASINYLQQAQYHARSRNSLRYLLDESEDYILNEITRAEVLRQVYQYIELLPSQCRKIILLSYSTGLRNQEIAKQLNISIHTVRNQKVRGLDLIRKRLEWWEKNQ